MELAKIFQLLDAGYTREQIEAFEAGLNEADPEEQEEITNEEVESTEEKQPINYSEQIANLNNSINDLRNEIQRINRNNDTFESKTKLTAEEALKQIWGG